MSSFEEIEPLFSNQNDQKKSEKKRRNDRT